jgi:hypothetical protein
MELLMAAIVRQDQLFDLQAARSTDRTWRAALWTGQILLRLAAL